MAGNFDLLGDLIQEGFGKRGRPPHRATDENRCKIMILLAIGRTNAEIALALGITGPTLRKNYFRELRTKAEARFRLEATNLLRLYQQVEDGNVGAIKELRKVLEKAALDTGPYAARPAAAQPKTRKLGKKEKAFLDAREPDTDTAIGDLMAQRLGRPN